MSLLEILIAGIIICLIIIINKLNKIFDHLNDEKYVKNDDGDTLKVKEFIVAINRSTGKLQNIGEEILEKLTDKK